MNTHGRPPHIVWFTRDLRIDDHEALLAGARGGDVVPLFVRDPAIVERGRMAPARRAYLEAAVASLDAALRGIGGRLVVRTGRPEDVIPAVAKEVAATTVHAHRDLTPFARSRARQIAQTLELVEHPGTLLSEPEAVGDVAVFAAFHRRWAALDRRSPRPAPARISVPVAVRGDPLRSPTRDVIAEAEQRLAGFAAAGAQRYATARDRLDVEDATSRLSAALHLGTISAQRVHDRIGSAAFRRQLAWRDWAGHLLWWQPEALRHGLRPRSELVAGGDEALLDAWRSGQTGYPVVDAAMRQLAAEGWISNRARLIVASFLTKDLLLDWRAGERHFLETLVDGDVANNSLGWQWTAGVGTDAAPYFRILNPVRQGQRFDPHGSWVRQWIPELRSVGDPFVHSPWTAPSGPPQGYPPPVVDHAARREIALARHRSSRPDGLVDEEHEASMGVRPMSTVGR